MKSCPNFLQKEKFAQFIPNLSYFKLSVILVSPCYSVKSVVGHLDGCRDFPRLCIGMFLNYYFHEIKFARFNWASETDNMYAGIGNPPGTMDMKAYLLQKFSTVERHQVYDSSN